jgi:predicted transposase YbfD/YdcC
MEYTSDSAAVNSGERGFVVDLGSLYTHLARLCDHRDRRGIRYALVTVLVYVILAKLVGQKHVRGIAEWIEHRKEALAEALGLRKARAPHPSTYSRILGHVVDIEQFERVVSEFFAHQPRAGQSVVIAVDGKTVRGTIAAGQTQGLHLLAAYLPQEGWVLAQVEVEGKENEIKAAPRLLKCLDLRDKVVTADALLAQRALSLQIVEAGGDYVWVIKDNQPQLRQDIELLFQPEQCPKGFSPALKDFRTASTVEKGHGRLEQRHITVSTELKDYLDWPYAQQVFKLARDFERLQDGKITHTLVYGVTSLKAQEAGPQRLLRLIRSHWGIENGLHYRRDETLGEDRCRLRTGHAARAMVIINNLVLGLLLRQGVNNVPAAQRRFDAHPEEALSLILTCPT